MTGKVRHPELFQDPDGQNRRKPSLICSCLMEFFAPTVGQTVSWVWGHSIGQESPSPALSDCPGQNGPSPHTGGPKIITFMIKINPSERELKKGKQPCAGLAVVTGQVVSQGLPHGHL